MPKDLVAKLHAEFVAIFREPDLRERFAKLGAEPGRRAPEDFDAFCRSERDRWGAVVKASGAKL